MIEPRDELEQVIRKDALYTDGPYTLASGSVTDWYINLRDILLRLPVRQIACDLLWEMIKEDVWNTLAGPMSGACPLMMGIQESAQRLTDYSYVRIARIRKEAKDHGKQERVVGRISRHDKVIIVEDVITSGGSALRAAEAVEELGGTPVMFISVVNRNSVKELVHKGSSIPVKSLFYGKDLSSEPVE